MKNTIRLIALLLLILNSCGKKENHIPKNGDSIPFHFEISFASQFQSKQEEFEYRISETLELLKDCELDAKSFDQLTQNHKVNLAATQKLDGFLYNMKIKAPDDVKKGQDYWFNSGPPNMKYRDERDSSNSATLLYFLLKNRKIEQSDLFGKICNLPMGDINYSEPLDAKDNPLISMETNLKVWSWEAMYFYQVEPAKSSLFLEYLKLDILMEEESWLNFVLRRKIRNKMNEKSY